MSPTLSSTRRLTLILAAGAMLAACAGPTPEQPVADDPQLLSSRWELTSWPNHLIPHGDTGEPVILTFSHEKGQGRVSGRAWCNQFSAPFSMRGPGRLTIVEAVTTRMACPEPAMRFEADFLEKLQAVNNYKITGSVLEMQTVDGKTMTFHAREKAGATAQIKFVYVAAGKAPCNAGAMKTTCYQIREDKKAPWQLWYGDIVGFKPEPGIEYRLRILEERNPNPPADASALKWTLDLVVEQELVKYRK
jgi:heat shock protein HslJ